MSRIEIPNSLAELRRINRDAYDWYLEQALPTIQKMIQDHSWIFARENPGLEVLLQDASPWPYLLGYATSDVNHPKILRPTADDALQPLIFQVTIGDYDLNLRPLEERDFVELKKYCHTLEKTAVEKRNFQITHPRVGIATWDNYPLTVQFPIEPVMKSWIYQ